MLLAVSSEVSKKKEACVLLVCIGSIKDSRVAVYNSILVLRIKDHICSDTVCPVAVYMLITQ